MLTHGLYYRGAKKNHNIGHIVFLILNQALSLDPNSPQNQNLSLLLPPY